MSKSLTASVYIGRFQPFHVGHLAMLRAALQETNLCVVVVGSAYSARSPKNPFSYVERAALIEQALSADERCRVLILPIRDYFDETRWALAAFQAVMSLLRNHGISDPAQVSLVGHFKDSSSDYLHAFPGWQLISLPRMGSTDASQIRLPLLNCELSQATQTLATLSPLLPDTTNRFLKNWLTTQTYLDMREEAAMLATYRKAWEAAPYPPVFVTVDSVVSCQDHVLLIRRANAPGKGRYALPGGFLEQQETTFQGALRELNEETQITINTALTSSRRGQAVFEHPARSLLGRVITHAYYFDLGDQPLPTVTGSDDARTAEWIPLSQLLDIEDRLHDDHFIVLDHFLHILDR